MEFQGMKFFLSEIAIGLSEVKSIHHLLFKFYT